MQEIFRFSTIFTDDIIPFTFGLTIALGCFIVAYWFYNRRRFHQLSHQIPATVIKNYLDSIIQNSSALKSSLFRGGGLDVQEGVPSVMSLGQLPPGPVAVGSPMNDEMLAQKSAELASIQGRLRDKERMVQELEKKLVDAGSKGGSSEGEAILKKEVARLQKELDAAKAGGGGDAVVKAELGKVTKERDELKERLMEYEIIEEDLANLKRLQQENEQLKATLAGMKGGGAAVAAAAAPVAAAAAAEEEEPAAEEAPAPAMAKAEEDDLPTPDSDVKIAPPPDMADAGPSAPASDGEQKSAEELLSEFEKMLG